MGGPSFTVPGTDRVPHKSAVTGTITGGTAADHATIDKLRKQDVISTLARDPVALTAFYTDDAVRLGPSPPAEVGKQTIRESNERQTANKGFKVLSYIPDYKELIFLKANFAVEWREFTASYITSPSGEPAHVHGAVLIVYKKTPVVGWKCFRAMGAAN